MDRVVVITCHQVYVEDSFPIYVCRSTSGDVLVEVPCCGMRYNHPVAMLADMRGIPEEWVRLVTPEGIIMDPTSFDDEELDSENYELDSDLDLFTFIHDKSNGIRAFEDLESDSDLSLD